VSVVGLIEPHTHGVRAYLLWDQHGLSPYWGFVNAYEPEHADRDTTFRALGSDWEIVSCSHWQGKIAPPESADFDGGLYEYKIKLEDADTIDRDVVVTVKPGYPDATHVDTGDPIGGIPDGCPESIRVEVLSTNVEPDDVISVVQAYLDEIGVNPEYLSGEPHQNSRLTRLERHVRLDRDSAADKLAGRSGVIKKLAQFADRAPLRGEHKWDHREQTGKYEHVRLDAATWKMLLDRDEQELGYEVKTYHPDNVRSSSVDPGTDPLRDPKLEVTYKKKWSREAVPWHERNRALAEVRTVLWNVLSWAGIDTDASNPVWTSDDYFTVRSVEVDGSEIVSTPLDALATAREEAVVDELATTSLSDEQRRVLIALFDTESNHYRALADRAEVGTSTVYRLLDNFSDLLQSMRGQIRFADEIVRDRVGGVVERLQDMSDWGRNRVREATERVSAIQDGALQNWVERYSIDILREAPKLELDLGEGLTREEAQKILRAGLNPFSSADSFDAGDLFGATVHYRDPEGVHRICRARVRRGGATTREWLVPLT